jgi:hypothetical protein
MEIIPPPPTRASSNSAWFDKWKAKNPGCNIECIQLAKIVTTAGTQIRARIDTETVDQYAEAMRDATNHFPPVVVFHDGSQFILADGYHRVMAATRNGFLDIEADIRKGTKSDALKFALGANTAHGLRRTNSDKRRSVDLALAEWPKLSDREIARICAVSHPFVIEMRRELVTVTSSPEPATRIGADGKERKLPQRKAPVTPAPSPPNDDPPRVKTAEEEMAAQTAPPASAPRLEEPEGEALAGIKRLFLALPPEHRARFLSWATERNQATAKLRCSSCEETFDDDSAVVPLYECRDCGDRYTPETSADGCSHRCPSCNKFGAKVSDMGCPECNEGELEDVTGGAAA